MKTLKEFVAKTAALMLPWLLPYVIEAGEALFPWLDKTALTQC